MSPLHERVSEALSRWLDFASEEAGPREEGSVGVPFTQEGGRNFKTWEMRRGVDLLRTAQETDPTGLTTLMLLVAEMEFYADEEQFTVRQFVRDEEVRTRIAEYREFITWLEEHEETRDAIEGFQRWLTKAVKRLVPKKRKDVAALIADVPRLARVRYDAVKGIEHLPAYQFAQGGEPRNVCRFSKFVYEFRDVEHLVLSMRAQKEDGISLALIRDEVVESSFFVFAIRCGDAVTILTDHERDKHPLQKHLRRSRMAGRDLDRRAMKFRFPYHLLNVEVTEEGDVRRTKPIGSDLGSSIADRVCTLDKLKSDEAVWLAIMFDLIKKKFWDERHEVPVLAITATEMDRPNPQLPNLTLDQVTCENVQGAFEGGERFDHFVNRWLEDRYAAEVPQEVYDVTSDRPLMLPDGRAKKEITVFKKVRDELRTLDKTAFGLPEELKRDQLFMTRYNQATAVGELAEQEFKTRERKIRTWFEKQVRANDQALLRAAVTGVLQANVVQPYDGSPFSPKQRGWKVGNICSQEVYVRRRMHPHPYGKVRLFGEHRGGCSSWVTGERHVNQHLCYLTGKQAKVWTLFRPNDAAGIATIAGCEVRDLPDVLQHWISRNCEPYDGNHLLDAIDPMRWRARDPWREEMTFEVLLGLSKSAWNGLLKQHGVPKRDLPIADRRDADE